MKLLLILSIIFFSFMCMAAEIDINAIIQIESSGNPGAYNAKSGAIGLMQITPICLEEFNNYYPKVNTTPEHLYFGDVNTAIGMWYIRRIRDHYLKGKGTIEDILICYNWGYGNWRKWKAGEKKLPKETRNYIARYNRLVGGTSTTQQRH